MKVSGVPRRANKVAQLAAEVAARQVARVQLRQTVSDKIGYAAAVAIGVVAGYAAWWVGVIAIAFYGYQAVRAYRRFKASGPAGQQQH